MPSFFIFIPASLFAIGILFASFFGISISLIWFFVLMACVFFVISILRPHRGEIFLLLGFGISAFAGGIFCMQNAITIRENTYRPNEGSHVVLGIVDSEPTLKSQKISFTLKVSKIDGETVSTDADINIQTEDFTHISYGDYIQANGTVVYPTDFQTPSGKIFPYVRYLEKDYIRTVMTYPEIEVVSHGNGNFIVSKLLSLKNAFLKNITRVVAEPEAGLLGGITIGARNSIPKDLENSFINTGTIHIVALSGYNISIVAESIIYILALVPFISVSLSYGIGALSIVLFAVMAGLSSTALRATLMALIAISARMLGRQYLAGRALILAGVGMLIFNPYLLVFDVSFQLSFLATFALVYFVPVISKYFSFLPARFKIRDLVATTIGIEIFLLPFLIFQFGMFSVISPLANILILPFVPPAMGFGFVSGILGFVSQAVSIPFGIISEFISKYIIFVVDKLSVLPFAVLELNFSVWLLLICYILMFFVIFRHKPKSNIKI